LKVILFVLVLLVTADVYCRLQYDRSCTMSYAAAVNERINPLSAVVSASGLVASPMQQVRAELERQRAQMGALFNEGRVYDAERLMSTIEDSCQYRAADWAQKRQGVLQLALGLTLLPLGLALSLSLVSGREAQPVAIGTFSMTAEPPAPSPGLATEHAFVLDPRGSASRIEYLLVWLGGTVIAVVLAVVVSARGQFAPMGSQVAFVALYVGWTLVPGIRRLHDLGRSGWFVTFNYFLCFALPVQLYLFFAPGTASRKH
jgi:hypothetical protein